MFSNSGSVITFQMYELFVIILMMTKYTDLCEAHVFCQDIHATDWTPLGYSCPINCASIVEAVKRLKQIDYDEIFSIHFTPFSPISRNSLLVRDGSQENYIEKTGRKLTSQEHHEYKSRKYISKNAYSDNLIAPTKLKTTHYIDFFNVLKDKHSGRDIQMAFKLAESHLKDSCRVINNQSNNTDCRRRQPSIRVILVKKITAILNRHNSSEYFTEDLTEMMLEKVLGKSIDAQLGIFNVQRVLDRLTYVISIHKTHARASASKRTITLKSKYCLNVYMPGCFCMPGYVEQRGQCVRASDCFPNPDNIKDYLARINVT